VQEKVQVFDCAYLAGGGKKEETKRWVRGENFTRNYVAFVKILK
jgi:hypothetical protein